MAAFTINAVAGKFSADHTAFICGYDLSNVDVPASFWSAVDADGGNIKVEDSGGARLPVDPVGFEKEDEKGWIWFRTDVASGSDNEFTVSTDGDGNTSYDADDVWQDYEVVVMYDQIPAINRVDGASFSQLGITGSWTEKSSPVSGIPGDGQGCAWDGTNYYLFFTNEFRKYDSGGSEVASNLDPIGDFEAAESITGIVHSGDGCVTDAGKIWVGMVDTGTPKTYLVRFDASDLSYDGVYHDITATTSNSAASVASHDGDLYVITFSTSEVHIFDEATGAFDSTLSTGISNQQGIVVANGYIWINAGSAGGGYFTNQVDLATGTDYGPVLTGAGDWQGLDYDPDLDEFLACIDPAGGSNVKITRYEREEYDLTGGGGIDLPSAGSHGIYISVSGSTTWTYGATYAPGDNSQDTFLSIGGNNNFTIDNGNNLGVWDSANSWLYCSPSVDPPLDPTMSRSHAVYVGTTERRIYHNGTQRNTESTITARGSGASNFFVAELSTGGHGDNFFGKVGFAYLIYTDLGSDWIADEYTMLDVNSTFWATSLPPDTPTITVTDILSTTATGNGSTYNHPDATAHSQSQWQVTTAADTGFASPVIDVTNGVDLESRDFTGLTAETDYIARVRYQDALGAWSSWSAVDSFTTASTIDAPTVVLSEFPTLIIAVGSAFVSGTGASQAATQWQLSDYDDDPTFASPLVDVTTTDSLYFQTYSFAGLDLLLNRYHVRARYQDDAMNWSAWGASAPTTILLEGQYYTAYAEPDLADDMDDRAAIAWKEVMNADESSWVVTSDVTATCEVLVQREQVTGTATAVDPIIFESFPAADKQRSRVRFKFDGYSAGTPCASGVTSPSGRICRLETGFVRREEFDDLDEWTIVREDPGSWEIVADRGHVDGSPVENAGNSALAYNFAVDSQPNALIIWEGAGSQPEGYWFQVATKRADIFPLLGTIAPWWHTGWPGIAFGAQGPNFRRHYSMQSTHVCGIFATWIFNVFYKHTGLNNYKLIDTFDATGRPFGAALSYGPGITGYEYMKVNWNCNFQRHHIAQSSQRGLQGTDFRVAFDKAHEDGYVGLVVNGCGDKLFASGSAATILFDNATICKRNVVEVRGVPGCWDVEVDHPVLGDAFDIENELGTDPDEPVFLDFLGASWPATVITIRDADGVVYDTWEVPATADAPKGIWGGDIFTIEVGAQSGPLAGSAVRVSPIGAGGSATGSGYFAYLSGGDLLVLAKGDEGGLTTLATYEFAHGPGVYYTVELDADGTDIRARVWAGDAEIPDWQIEVVDSDYATGAPGQVALSDASVGFDVLSIAIGDQTVPSGRNPGAPTWILPTGDKWFTPSDPSVNIEWSVPTYIPAPMGIDNLQYEVQYRNSAIGGPWIPLVTQASTTYTWDVSSLTREQPHCLRVRATVGCEVGPWEEICETEELSIGQICDDYEVIWLQNPELNDLETDFVAGDVHQYARRFKGVQAGTSYPSAQLTIKDTEASLAPLVQKTSTPVDNGDGSIDVTITLTEDETTSIGSRDAKIFELRLTDNVGNEVIPNMGLIRARATRISF